MKTKKRERIYVNFLKTYAFKRKLVLLYSSTIIIIIFTAGISLVRPELQADVIDSLGNPKNTDLSSFMLLLAVFLGALLINYLLSYVQRFIVAVISEEIAADIRQRIQDKLSTVKVSFFHKIKLSDILLKVDKDVAQIKQCGITSIITLISNIVILLVVPPYMFSIHKGIAVSNILLLISVPFFSRLMGNWIQETSEKVLEGYNSSINILTNTYDSWFITRIFQCGQYVHDRYFEKNEKYKVATNKQNLLYIANTATILVIQFLGTAIIWVVGAQEVFKGTMTIGTIMALMNYQTIIMNPIIGIAQFANEYHTAIVSLKDINELLEYPNQEQNKGKTIEYIDQITLKNVDFSYSGNKKKVLEKVNLEFKKGNIYGLHGRSGQGKSTLFNLITGMYQPTDGKVLINYVDLQEIDINTYWKSIGYVLQRSQFFNDSIRRNMNLLHKITNEEMDVMAKCLDLYEEIHSLKEEWDTEIVLEPANFSEGQLRRLDIMRNILKKAQVLIFDEATANIDKERRTHFYSLLHDLSENKIIIFSTHNIDELREADEVIDLEKISKGEEERWCE